LAAATRECHASAVRDPRVIPLLVLCFGCHASVQADANASTSGQGDAELDAEVQKERAAAPPEDTAPKPDAPPSGERPLLGARTDLSLVPAQVASQCSCLRVALGPATLGAFRWKGERPAIDERTQLVVALTSEGSGCDNPKGSIGASYWGYRRSGNDIVVYVENGVAGRPLATGAIIPKPFGQGQVYVAPVTKKTPFGKAQGGKGSCKLGNPGAPRTVPISPDETGAVMAGSPGAGDGTAEDMLSGR
jgi:hypothetical protein